MTRRKIENAESVARREIGEEIQRVVDQLALSEGPASDAESVSDARVLKLWGQRDPKISDADGLKAHLMQAGLPPELLDPNSPTALTLIKSRPQMAEMFANPADEGLAHMLSRLAEFPLRLDVLEPFEDDPERMVKEAERIDGLWQRSRARQTAAVEEGA